MTDLRSKAKTCEFGALTEDLIRDRLICGIVNDRTRSRLLKKADLTLAPPSTSTALDICHADEAASTQVKLLSQSTTQQLSEPTSVREVETIQKLRRRPLPKLHPFQTPTGSTPRTCGHCGGEQHHPQQGCPAYGSTCRNCGRRNHFAKVCRSKSSTKFSRVQAIEHSEPISDDDEDLIISAITDKTNK